MSATCLAGLSTLNQALQSFGDAVKAGVTGSVTFVGDSVSASYNLFGEHTFPQKDFRTHPNPKKISDLNKFGLALLTVVPVLPLTIFLSATVIPVIGNSYHSLVNTFVPLVNLPLFDLEEKKLQKDRAPGIASGPDTRGFLRQFYGLPGLILGATIAIPVMSLITVGRFFTETCKTSLRAFNTIANIIYYPHSLGEGLEQNDNRHWARKYGIGMLGIPIGLMAGIIASPAVFFFRVLRESLRTAKRTIFSAIKLSLYPQEVNLQGLEQNDDRYLVEKYLIGGFGFLSGLAIGGLAATGIIFGRLILANIRSWQALSGSFLNGAFNAKIFYGIAGDSRGAFAKTLGSVGYVAALTMLPLAATVFTLRQIPSLIANTVGIAISPFIFFAKVAALSVRSCVRKSEPINPTIQRLNDLKSSLTINGYFRTNKPVSANGSEHEGICTIIRKSVTYNRETRSEKILSTFRTEYQKFLREQQSPRENSVKDLLQRSIILEENGPHAALKLVADEVKRSVINDLMSSHSCFATQLLEEQEEIKRIVDFVLAYLIGDDDSPGPSEKRIPPDLYKKQSWFLTFRGVTKEDEENAKKVHVYDMIPHPNGF